MPRVTSDGRHVVFFLARELALNLWRMNLDGSDPVRVTQGGLDYGHSLSPDDKWIVYSDDPFTGNRLARVSVEGGETSPVYEKRSQWPEVSPDGLQIALRAWSPGESRFRWEIIPFEGGDVVRALEIELPGDPTRVQWSPDGKALTYVREEGGIGNIWSQPIGGGPPEQLTHFDNGRIASFSWSPDGNRIALSRGRSLRDLILISNFR